MGENLEMSAIIPVEAFPINDIISPSTSNLNLQKGNERAFNLDDVPTMKENEIRKFRDDRGFSLLMLASEAGHIEAVKNLLAREILDINFEVANESAISLAFTQGLYEICLMLLKENAKFSPNINREIVSDELKMFLDLSNEMHVRIRDENDNENLKSYLRQRIEANAELKYFYNTSNYSLIRTALEVRKFEIFKFLWDLNLKLSFHENLHDLLRNFTNTELENFQNLYLAIFDNFKNLSDREITQFYDFRGYNILMMAAEFGKIEELKYCIDRGLFILDAHFKGISAASLAYEHKNFEILLLLLEADARFPPGIDPSQIEDENLKKFVDMSILIHSFVELNEVEKIEALLNESCLKYFYDLDNRSLFRHAIESKKFEVYKILMKKHVTFGPYENFNAMLAHLSEDAKEELSDIQLELADPLVSPTVLSLMAHSFVGVDSKNQKRTAAMEAFNFLLKVQRAEIILKIVATQKDYQIVFDFTRDTVQFVDPSSELYTSALFYQNGRIYIAANKLFDEEGKYEVMGALIHELCHFAMFITFKNFAEPYHENDSVKTIEFESIIQKCEALKDREEIIRLVYAEYEASKRAAELIVRPVQIDVHYYGLDELEEKEKDFKELFDFYDDHCMPEMEKILPELQAEANFTEKDVKIENLKKFNVGLMILVAMSILLGGLVAFLIFNPTIKWSDLTSVQQNLIKNWTVDFYGVEKKLDELFTNDSKIFELLSSEQFKQALKGDPEVTSDIFHKVLLPHVVLTWSNTTLEHKSILLNTTVEYQNVEVKFGELFSNDSKIFDLLSSEQIKKVLKGEIQELSRALNEVFDPFVILSWSNMTQKLKDKFLTREIEFQGKKIEIGKIAKEDSTLKLLEPTEVKKILTNSFQFSPLSPQKTKIYIERFFTNENNKVRSEKFCRYLNFNFRDSADCDYDMFYKNGKINASNPLVKGFDKIVKKLNDSRIFLLSSPAGDGKSTTFQKFSFKLKEKFPQKWIQYVDLKKHLQGFEMGRTLSLNDVQNISSFLGDKVLGLKGFEFEVFKELFTSENVIFLWDGVDEISPNFKDFILDLTYKVLRTNNLQFISTRPQHSNDFQTKFKMTAQKLIPFSELDRFELLVKIIAMKRFNEDESKVFEELKEFHKKIFQLRNEPKFSKYYQIIYNAQEIFQSIERQRTFYLKDQDRFMSNPLLISMISEISFDENFKVKDLIVNSYQLYDIFFFSINGNIYLENN